MGIAVRPPKEAKNKGIQKLGVDSEVVFKDLDDILGII